MNTKLNRIYSGLYSKMEIMQTTMDDQSLAHILLAARFFQLTSIELEVFIIRLSSLKSLIFHLTVSGGAGHCIRSAEAVLPPASLFCQGNAKLEQAAGNFYWYCANRTHGRHGPPNCAGD